MFMLKYMPWWGRLTILQDTKEEGERHDSYSVKEGRISGS